MKIEENKKCKYFIWGHINEEIDTQIITSDELDRFAKEQKLSFMTVQRIKKLNESWGGLQITDKGFTIEKKSFDWQPLPNN
jgi:hypothetical protein